MIYGLPESIDPVDQGDIVDGCPIVRLVSFDLSDLSHLDLLTTSERIVVLTQTCDLVHQKASAVTVAVVHDAQTLVDGKLLKPADIRGPIRAGRVFGWYFFPKNIELGLAEAIVDLRQLHTVRLDLLTALCRRGQRRARVQPLYREHLGRHLGDTFGRIGLPDAYPTD